MTFLKKLFTFFLLILFSSQLFAKEKKDELLFYVGITMIKPMSKLAKEFEKENNCKIKIMQGGSQDLYNSIKTSNLGDLYLPGSISYREKHLKDGLLLDAQFVGYNKLAMVVKKGNPLNIKADLSELTNPKLRVVLGSVESGSVGNATKKILVKFGNYQKAMLNTLFLAPDSRNLTASIKEDKADLIINWYATTFWDNNYNYIQAIELDDKYSNKAILALNLLKSSKNPELTKKFMKFASSKRGKDIFYNYGFLNDDEYKNFEKVKIK